MLTPAATAFGTRGDVMLDAGLFFSMADTTFSKSGYEDATRTSVAVNPGAGVFIGKGVFLRGQVDFRYDSANQKQSHSAFGIGAGVGASSLVLDSRVSLLPSVTLMHLWERDKISGEPVTPFNRLLVALSVKVLFHPVRHFFFGLGPTWTHSLVSRLNDNKGPSSRTFSVEGAIGVWF